VDTTFETSFDQDEFEEVESPFEQKPKSTRFRKNNKRPLNTTPSEAPLIADEIKSISHAQIEYLDSEDEEEEEVEKLPTRSRPKSRKVVKKKNKFAMIIWSILGLMFLRMVFMERGVIDYIKAQSVIHGSQEELVNIRKENKMLGLEINRMRFDKAYQKQLAKEHLGVIAQDEFLILFAGESQESSSEEDHLP
jgi:cell division protein FtsB